MITILSYCDTNEKKNQLSNLITSLKIKFPEKKILVYSHYQDLEPKYYKGTDYYIFDITNPISTKSFTDWIYVYHQYKKFHRSGIDCGFAVMQMIKRACLFLLSFNPGPMRDQMNIMDIDLADVRPIALGDFQAALTEIRASVSPKDLAPYEAWNTTYGSFR